jgi:hydroxymethylpyrimidine kinase/phosphomethylpyrimidine kinase
LHLQTTLLSIAGSDPTGGAGIQADLKTMTSLGVYGAAAITCITVQNATGVREIIPLDPELVKNQIHAVLQDHKVGHIKIGMTGNTEIISCLALILKGYKGEVIYDPVLAATSGKSLMDEGGIDTLRETLLKRVTYLTPNRIELEVLGQQPIASGDDAIACAQNILKQYPSIKGIVVKGGHLEESSPIIKDILVGSRGILAQSVRTRLLNPHLHGTGCTYSSAFASYLARGKDPASAIELTGIYMDTLIAAGIEHSVSLSSTNGPLLHCRTAGLFPGNYSEHPIFVHSCLLE